MTRSLILLLGAATLFAADDPWTKVKELKSGTEIRILRAATPTPIEGRLDEVRDNSVVVVVKNEQKAIPKDSILRLDYRPKGGGMTKETKVKTTDPDPTPPVGMSHGANVPGQSSSTSVGFGSKPAYETIYRRLSHSMLSEHPPEKK